MQRSSTAGTMPCQTCIARYYMASRGGKQTGVFWNKSLKGGYDILLLRKIDWTFHSEITLAKTNGILRLAVVRRLKRGELKIGFEIFCSLQAFYSSFRLSTMPLC